MKGSSRTTCVAAAALLAGASLLSAADPALTLRIAAIGAGTPASSWSIELHRWPTDAERAPLHAALSAPPPPPPPPAGAAAGRGRAGGRGGRGATPPPSADARLTAAVKAAPTCGFIWGAGPTGYSIKYAWRSSSPDGAERIVLVIDRRLEAYSSSSNESASAPSEQDFTVVEMRIDAKGNGEGKTSLGTKIVMDATANTLALDGYGSVPAHFKVTR